MPIRPKHSSQIISNHILFKDIFKIQLNTYPLQTHKQIDKTKVRYCLCNVFQVGEEIWPS